MIKKKIVFWGINDLVLKHIRCNIDPRKAEIVFFVDSDKNKIGNCYMDIPVVELDKIEISMVDYFFIVPFSAYQEIRKQLIEYGVAKEKIQLFVTKNLSMYNMGSLEDVDIEVIRNLYFQPERTIRYLTDYHTINREYQAILPCEEIKEAWYNKCTLISHACGGIVNGEKKAVSNSKEALQYSIDKGFVLIECDMLIANGELTLAHDYARFYEADEKKYSIMKARELFEILKDNPQISCVIDVKWNEDNGYAKYISEIEKILQSLCKNEKEYKQLKKQIIMEVYDETTIKIALATNFEVTFTQYKNPNRCDYKNIVKICNRYNIKSVILEYGAIPPKYFQRQFLQVFTNKNIKVIAYTINNLDDYCALCKAGVTGVMTDYLTKEDIEKGMAE